MTKTLRINFELDRDDNPPLYDELVKFAKGAKRVNRLRTLAYAGLIAQITRAERISLTSPEQQAHDSDPTHAAATMELFGPSI
jgi:hypothetical protein